MMILRSFLCPIALAFVKPLRPHCWASQVSPQLQVGRHCSSAVTSKTMAQPTIPYDHDNVFSKILEGKLPAHKIFETEHCIAILDAFPAVRGHSLLIPKARVATVLDMTAEQAAEVFRELPRLSRAVQQATGSDGVTVLHNAGAAAGQVVFHLHFHVIPRFNGDKLMQQPSSAKAMIAQQEAEAVLTQIKAHL